MKDYSKAWCESVIRLGEAYAARHDLKWTKEGRYPRLPFDGYSDERARYEAWYIDSLCSCAQALLAGNDMRYALRCMFQVREYSGRLQGKWGVGAPDSYWSDKRTLIQSALEDALGCDHG